MKKNWLIGGAAMLTLGIAGYAIVSSVLAPTVWARDTMRDGRMFIADFGPNGGPGALAQRVNLTQSQREQIKSILAREKPEMTPLVQQLRSTFQQAAKLTDDGTADPAKVHALIDGEQSTIADLIVDGVRTKTAIYNTVLTPTQQKQAQEMLTDVGPRIEDHIDKLPQMTGRMVDMAAWRLDLTDAQKSQIQSIVDGGVQKDLPLVKQLAQDRDAMVNVTGNGRFNEAEVRKVADSTASTATSLAGDALVLKSQVFAVLTPAQREKACVFHQAMHAHRAARFGFRHGGA